MTRLKKFQLSIYALLYFVFFAFWGMISLSSCSTVNTHERGINQNPPGFSIARKATNKRLEHSILHEKLSREICKEDKEIVRELTSDLKSNDQERNLENSILSSPIYVIRNTEKNRLTSALKDVNRYRVVSQESTGQNTMRPTQSTFWTVKSSAFKQRVQSYFGPQNDLIDIDDKTTLIALGWVFLVGGPLLLMLSFSYIDLTIFLLGCLFFVLIGLFYFWAASLYDELDYHCRAYRIGYYLTVFSWPLGFTLLIGIPLWIGGAIYDLDR